MKRAKTAEDESRAVAVNVRPMPPAVETITPLKVVAGENTRAINLRDHPELDGKTCIVVEARFMQGSEEMGDYVIFGAYIVPDANTQAKQEDFVMIMTGAENVYTRIASAVQDKVLPVSGTLRRVQGSVAGRSMWFLD